MIERLNIGMMKVKKIYQNMNNLIVLGRISKSGVEQDRRGIGWDEISKKGVLGLKDIGEYNGGLSIYLNRLSRIF